MGALGRGVLFNIALNAFRRATLGCLFLDHQVQILGRRVVLWRLYGTINRISWIPSVREWGECFILVSDMHRVYVMLTSANVGRVSPLYWICII